MIEETISTKAAQRFYDRLGAGHDWAERYEGRAKARALILLDLASGQRILNAGVGTGQIHAQLLAAIGPGGTAIGLDLSPVMLARTQTRTGAPGCEADVRRLPFQTATFDRLFSSYVLDLIPLRDLTGLLVEFRRVLKPTGRMALVSLTEGDNLSSRVLIGLWKMIYRINPQVCGGCRPLQLSDQVRQAGFTQVRRETVVQLGIPSEVIIATS